MSQELVERIRREIARTGPITFARYMELALYDPEYGYYTTGLRTGRAGDYLTAPEAHPIFGWVVAHQLRELWETLGKPEPFTLVEYGPGTGTLALAIFAELDRAAPALLARLQYWPIERSQPAHEQLEHRLADAGFAPLLVQSPAPPVTGVVLANELVDALPVHRIRCQGGQLWELFVGWDGERFVEIPGPPSTPELERWLARLGVRLVEGQTTELCLAMLDWLDEVAALLARGYLLVFDYGYPAPERHDPARFPSGSVRTYVQHCVDDDPFAEPGERDITSHVDFTMLELAAEERSLVPLGLTTQAEFLAHGGLGERLVALQNQPGVTAEQYLAARAAAFHLLDPSGMGRFRVALFGKNVPQDAVPTGFRPRLLTGVPLPSSPERSPR
ncbi:hypothetical protein HRbin27_01379 [bacterium HR27]|nr:hypothetical protein HRbin27_01379 [bacterium HR27]